MTREIIRMDGTVDPIQMSEIKITQLDNLRSVTNCKAECEKMGLALVRATCHPMHHSGRNWIIDLATQTTKDSVHKAAIYKNGMMTFQHREIPLETGQYWIGYDPSTAEIYIERIKPDERCRPFKRIMMAFYVHPDITSDTLEDCITEVWEEINGHAGYMVAGNIKDYPPIIRARPEGDCTQMVNIDVFGDLEPIPIQEEQPNGS